MIEKGKPYTPKQLKEIFGEDYFEKKSKLSIISTKQKIKHFEEFDEFTKEVYKKIYDEVIRCNRSHPHAKVYATGSRVSGMWKTPEESEEIAKNLGIKPKYSDYDYWTDAPVKPSKNRLDDLTGVETDFIKGGMLIQILPKKDD